MKMFQVSSTINECFRQLALQVEFFIRKGARLFEYAVLGILLYRAVQTSGISRGRVLTLSLLLSFLYASSDEWHQSFTMNRTPLFTDVLIDSVGAFFGLIMALIFFIKKADSRITICLLK